MEPTTAKLITLITTVIVAVALITGRNADSIFASDLVRITGSCNEITMLKSTPEAYLLVLYYIKTELEVEKDNSSEK